MPRHIIIGTAGHIDHGKTTLVKALTGIDTDRLKEEKERGITIELGFAHLTLPSGVSVGIVDVPGHERFVRHMVAGAAGIDMVMLVIAADEGVMPQTREHLDICRILGIKRGLIVLTKSDMVEPDWLDLIAADVRQFCANTFLADEPLVSVSSTTGAGLTELRALIDRMVPEIEPRPPWGIFRLPVDRVFTMKGFGTVITGTAASGTVRVGDTVRVYPHDLETKVRGLQVHNMAVSKAEAGQRTAVNLQGVEKQHVARGHVVGYPGQLQPSFIMNVKLNLLAGASKKLAHRARLRFHLGTAEILGRVHFLESDSLEPGQEALAQIRLETPTVALARDRFVIRSYSPLTTIGGGSIIDPAAAKFSRQKKSGAGLLDTLKSLEKGSPQEAVSAALRHDGPSGSTLPSLSRALNLDEKLISGTLESLEASGQIHRLGHGPGDLIFHAKVISDLGALVTDTLNRFHREFPLKPGLSREELKTKLPKQLSPKALVWLMDKLNNDGVITGDGTMVRLASYRVQLDKRQQDLRQRMEKLIRAADLAVPSPEELAKSASSSLKDATAIINVMVNEGTLIKVFEDIFIHARNLEFLKERLLDHFALNKELTVGDFKELTNLSRKYSIPILEYFDRHGLTLRVGDKRVLKKT